MKFINIFLIVAIILNFNFLKADEIKTENKIAKNLRCLICQGQSVYDSDSEFAISLKLVIKNKIQEGLNEEQIYSFLKDLGNPYDIIVSDKDGTASIEWGAYGVPESFLVYQNKIIKRFIGPINNEDLLEIQKTIK